MGASSTQGVSGYGTTQGVQKGNEHMSLGVERLVGPRPVYNAKVTLSSGSKTFEVVLPTATVADYIVLLSNQSANASCGVTAFTIDSTTKVASITVTGTGSNVIAVSIQKVGYAGAAITDGVVS